MFTNNNGVSAGSVFSGQAGYSIGDTPHSYTRFCIQSLSFWAFGKDDSDKPKLSEIKASRTPGSPLSHGAQRTHGLLGFILDRRPRSSCSATLHIPRDYDLFRMLMGSESFSKFKPSKFKTKSLLMKEENCPTCHVCILAPPNSNSITQILEPCSELSLPGPIHDGMAVSCETKDVLCSK